VNAVPMLATTLLADGENKKSGPIGLAVILLLCLACYFLFKSMSKHLRKVREEFPVDPDDVQELIDDLIDTMRAAPDYLTMDSARLIARREARGLSTNH